MITMDAEGRKDVTEIREALKRVVLGIASKDDDKLVSQMFGNDVNKDQTIGIVMGMDMILFNAEGGK